jgi:hypothetical protein
VFSSRILSDGIIDSMNDSSVNKAWEFECVLESGKELKSWFYSDTKQDASNRVKNFMGAKLISIKEISDPLEIRKKQMESDKIRDALAKKRNEEFQARQKFNNSTNE